MRHLRRCADALVSGLGRDVMGGGAGGDVIDLVTMDAVTATAEDEAFTWFGNAAFAGVAGELRYAGGMLAGDVNGDRVADFEIQLNGAPFLDPNLHPLL